MCAVRLSGGGDGGGGGGVASILRDLRRTVRSDEQQTAPETPTEY